jgi:hypothetical protein
MSDQQPARPTGRRPRRDPWVTALLILVGLFLLLPGLCTLIASAIFLTSGYGADLALLWLMFLCLAAGAGGVALIVRAIRR